MKTRLGSMITVAASLFLASSATSVDAALFTENFNSYSGNQNDYQYETGLKVAHSGSVSGWSNMGDGTMHAVDLSGSGNWAIMFWQNNVITLSAGIAANSNGVTYKVDFDYGTAVYASASQLTTATDSLLVEVVRADNSVLASGTYAPGDWSNPNNVNLSAGLHGILQYVGDGSGVVRLRIGPTPPLSSGHFEGEIDNVSVSAGPTLASSAIVDDKSGGPVDTGTVVTYTVTFSQDMDASTVSADDFGNAGTAGISIGTVTETTPTSGIFTVPVTTTSSGTLQLKVNAGAVLNDAEGIPLVTTSAIVDDTTLAVVTTGETTPPAIATLSPADNAIGVVTIANLVVTFSEAITIGTGDITIKNLTDNSQTTIAITSGSPQVSVSGAILTINPTADLAPSKSYAIQIDATAIKDLSGNSFAGIVDDMTWNFTTARILADARSDFRTTTAGGTTADFNGGTGISDIEKSGRWNYLNGTGSTLLTFGVAGNAGQSMYQSTGQTDGLPALGDQQIFGNVPGPAAGKIQWHAGATDAQSAVMRWTAGAKVTNLMISGTISRGYFRDLEGWTGNTKFDILVNGVNQFTILLNDTAPHSFLITGLSIIGGQHVEFILSTPTSFNAASIADLQATIYGDVPPRGTLISIF